MRRREAGAVQWKQPSKSDLQNATFLLLLIGIFGCHRLFLGHVVSGVIQFVVGMAAVGSLIVGTPVLLMPTIAWLLSDLYLLLGGYMNRQAFG